MSGSDLAQVLCAACGELTPPGTCVHDACGSSTALRDRWDLLSVAGRGSFGVTYRARDRRDGAIVAVKESPLSRVSDLKTRELLMREIDVLRGLAHPDIPAFVDGFVDGHGNASAVYVVQTFIEGTPLDEQRLDVDQVLDVLEQLLGVLAWLHTRAPAIVHRDIKPSNVLRRPDGRIVLIDFGMVKEHTRRVGSTLEAGTAGYQAPEQVVGEAVPASDLYGAAAAAVALLNGRGPLELTRYDKGGPVIDIPETVAVAPPIRSLLSRMLAADPDARPSSAAEALALLRGHRAALRAAPLASAPAAEPSAAARPGALRAASVIVLGALLVTVASWGHAQAASGHVVPWSYAVYGACVLWAVAFAYARRPRVILVGLCLAALWAAAAARPLRATWIGLAADRLAAELEVAPGAVEAGSKEALLAALEAPRARAEGFAARYRDAAPDTRARVERGADARVRALVALVPSLRADDSCNVRLKDACEAGYAIACADVARCEWARAGVVPSAAVIADACAEGDADSCRMSPKPFVS